MVWIIRLDERNSIKKEKTINENDFNNFVLVDDIDEAVNIIDNHYKENNLSLILTYDKNSKKLKLFISTLFFCFNSYSQNINGVIIDESTNETLLGANIRIIGGSGAHLILMVNLLYKELKILLEIECSYIGYETQIKEIKNFDKIIIKLTQDKLQLKEVEVIEQ